MVRKSRLKQRRRSSFETLERRELLAAVLDPTPTGWWSDSFVVRRDEAKPIEIRLNGWSDQPVKLADLSAHSISGSVSIDSSSLDGGYLGTNPSLTLLYRPQNGFVGIDQISFDFVGQTSGSASGDRSPGPLPDVAVNVVEPLFAVEDWYQVGVNSISMTLDVLANDGKNANYIGDEPDLSLDEVWFTDDLGGGQIRIADDRLSVLYQPQLEFEGVRNIAYRASDEDGYRVMGHASIRVSDLSLSTAWPEQLQNEATQLAVSQNEYWFGAAVEPLERYRFEIGDDFGPNVESDDVSGTNNQVAGVEESDRVKTDGDYLYVLSTPESTSWFGWDIFPRLSPTFEESDSDDLGNLLTVVDIRQPDFPTIVSRQVFDDPVSSLDLVGNRLTVITTRQQATVLNVLDVSAPANPAAVWTTVIDGNYVESRRVGEILYVFTDSMGYILPPLGERATADKQFRFHQTAEQYFANNSSDDLIEALLPSQRVFDEFGAPNVIAPVFPVDPLEISLEFLKSPSQSHLVSFNPTSSEGLSIDWHWEERVDHRLVTSDSIYTTRTIYQGQDFSGGLWDTFSLIPADSTNNTWIRRYQLDGTGLLTAAATGFVPGTLNNRFSIDEHEGHLRVATENSWWTRVDDSTPPPGTNLYVLEQQESRLELIGGVEGLAPGEQVYSVRFSEDRGYIVTFRQVDPLFVIDLSEPETPIVTGQLKIPGYSQYLHVVDDQTLLGIGRDANEQTGQYESMVISLFDVSNPADPVLSDRYEFEGGRSTFSPYSGGSPRDVRDHHAISFFAQEQVLAVPVYSELFGFWEPTESPIFDLPDQSEVRTFKVDRETGINPIDAVGFDTRADRTVRIGSLLYSLSNQELKVSHLHESAEPIAALKFESKGQDDYFDVISGQETIADLTANDLLGDQELLLLKAELLEGQAEIRITNDHQLHFRPLGSDLTPSRIRYLAEDSRGILIEAYATIDPDLVWQNVESKFDVNQDGAASARDVLNIINLIAQHGVVDCEELEAFLGTANSMESRVLFDTSGDRRLSAIDALQVINHLYRLELSEGEEVFSQMQALISLPAPQGIEALSSRDEMESLERLRVASLAEMNSTTVDAIFSTIDSVRDPSRNEDLNSFVYQNDSVTEDFDGDSTERWAQDHIS